MQCHETSVELMNVFRFFFLQPEVKCPQRVDGPENHVLHLLVGDSDVLIRVPNEQYIFINYFIISIILVYLCELFQSKRLVWTVSRLPELIEHSELVVL